MTPAAGACRGRARFFAGAGGALIAATFGAGAASGCADDGGPRLEAVMPPAARREAIVTVTGHRLCGDGGDCARVGGEVLLGIEPPMVRVGVVSYSDTVAEVAIPSIAPVGATELIITVGERSSNALAFEVLP